MDRRTDGRTDGRIDGWMDGWMDEQTLTGPAMSSVAIWDG